jgi:hypothetical protein
MKAVLRLYQGSIKAVLRLYQGSMKAVSYSHLARRRQRTSFALR